MLGEEGVVANKDKIVDSNNSINKTICLYFSDSMNIAEPGVEWNSFPDIALCISK
jgi:hypothetical protein